MSELNYKHSARNSTDGRSQPMASAPSPSPRQLRMAKVDPHSSRKENVALSVINCVLVYARQQVSKSAVADVPEGYCLTKTPIKSFSGYS